MNNIISIYPNKDLFEPTRDIPLDQINSETYTQIGSSMLETLRKKGGIGLSANQVGLPLNMCVIELTSSNPMIMLNPTIIKYSDKMVKSREGCLSIPGAVVVVDRHKDIVVSYQDVNANTIELKASGTLSNCLQHEIDHLKGVLMVNRLNEFNKNKAIKAMYTYKKRRGQR